MNDRTAQQPNTWFIEVSGAGLAEVDGLYIPSQAPPTVSESGTVSSVGYWNGKPAWDRADGRSQRSPAISYSNTYKAWRICRLDGHLAYELTCEDELPPTDRAWNVYKKGVAPAPAVALYRVDPRLPCPSPNVVFVLGGPGAGKGTMCELAAVQLGWVHLSAGDLLRDEVQAGGPHAAHVSECINAGALVSAELIAELLKNAMEATTRTTGVRNFLVDGFPRSLANLQAWLDVFGPDTELPAMLYFECPFEVLEKRILGRAKFSGRIDEVAALLVMGVVQAGGIEVPFAVLCRAEPSCAQGDALLGLLRQLSVEAAAADARAGGRLPPASLEAFADRAGVVWQSGDWTRALGEALRQSQQEGREPSGQAE